MGESGRCAIDGFHEFKAINITNILFIHFEFVLFWLIISRQQQLQKFVIKKKQQINTTVLLSTYLKKRRIGFLEFVFNKIIYYLIVAMISNNYRKDTFSMSLGV